MDRDLMRMHIEERVYPGARERYKLAAKSDARYREVLRAEAHREHDVLALVRRHGPALLRLRDPGAQPEGAVERAFYFLLNPGLIDFDTARACETYCELREAIVNAA